MTIWFCLPIVLTIPAQLPHSEAYQQKQTLLHSFQSFQSATHEPISEQRSDTITKPELPPIFGYVEVDVEGERKYMNVHTGEILDGVPVQSPEQYTEIELAQQAITDLELSDIEQGQQITDLELIILEGRTNV